MKESNSKKIFAPSIEVYRWIQILSSFGIWFMTFYFGYPLWHTIVVCILLGILTWSTHIRGAAMGMYLASTDKKLRRFINESN